jgi:hypothetical protein
MTVHGERTIGDDEAIRLEGDEIVTSKLRKDQEDRNIRSEGRR